MKIKILGMGCGSCNKLEENVKQAIAELNLAAEIEKIMKVEDIIGYGVMSLPALVVDDEVKFSGKILSVNDLKSIFKK